MGEGISIQVDFESPNGEIRPSMDFCIKNNYGVAILTASSRVQKQYRFENPLRKGSIVCHLADLPLLNGMYSIDLFFGEDYQNTDLVYDAISFEVIEADVFDCGQVPPSNSGTIFWPAQFEMQTAETATHTASHYAD
jgi:hypothetical protein